MKEITDLKKSFLVAILHVCWMHRFMTMMHFYMLQSIRSILFGNINLVTKSLKYINDEIVQTDKLKCRCSFF